MTIDPDLAGELIRRALLLVLLLSAPVLLAGLIVGVAVSLVQAVTQVQEQSLSFIPKIVAMFAAAIVTLPWVTGQLLEFAREVFAAAGHDPERILPITTDELDPPRPAPRPANSVLDNMAWRLHGFTPSRDFREPLAEVVARLQAD